MSVHADITRKTDVEVALNMANAAYGLASGMMTTNAGAVFIPDGELADGEDAGRNGILIGSDANGFNGAAHVNDGKLEPIVDTSALEAANAEFQEALDAAKARMDDQQGNLNDAIDRMEQNRQEAADATQGVRDDLAKTEDSMNSYIESNDKAVSDAVTSISTVSTAADNAQKAADKVAGDLKATDVKVSQNTTNLGGLSTQMTAVKETADASLGLSTQHTQDIKGINDTLTMNYITKDETLTKVAEVQKTADAISAQLSSDYTTTADADAKFSTKTELTATANEIKSDVSETYSTKESVTNQVATVQQSADEIALNLSMNYQNKNDIAKTYATQAALNATSEAITTEVSKKYATIAVTDQLKNIADNAIETFMGSAVPTTSNAPAKDWNTDLLKKQHSGDIYYSTTDGKSYRYGNPDNTGWKWTLILDTDITKALQDAAKAQGDADKANNGVTKLNTDLPLLYATKTSVSETAEAIKLEASKTYATQQSLTEAQTAIKITTDGITADISKNYQKTSAADGKYATKTSLQATDDKIATSISEQSSKDDVKYSTKSELTQKSNELSGKITETASTANNNLTTTKNEFNATVDSIKKTLSQTNELVGYASFPNELDKNHPNQWYCAIYPIASPPANMSNGSYDSFAGLTARYTKYATDGKGDLISYAIDYSWYITRTLVSFDSDTTWQFTCFHDDSCRMLVDGETVYYASGYKSVTDTITINFKAGSHTFDVIVGNGTGGAGIKNFSVPLSTIATTMYAPASQSEVSKRVSEAEQTLDTFKNTVEETYTTKSEFSKASVTYNIRDAGGTSHPYYKLGTLTQPYQGKITQLDVTVSNGNNGQPSQNKTATIYIHKGWTGGGNSNQYGISVLNHNWPEIKVIGLTPDKNNSPLEVWLYASNNFSSYLSGNYVISGACSKWVEGNTYADADPTGSLWPQSVSYYESPEQAKQSLANEVAQTYTTKSEFTQTTNKIQSQVTQSLGAVSGGNMVYNPGFELGQTENSTTTNWAWGGDGVTGRIETSNTNTIHSGSYRFYASLPSGKSVWVNSQSSMSLMLGHTYKVSAWVYLDTKGTIDLGIETNVPSTLGDYDRAVQVNAGGGWTEVSTYITATRDYAKAHVFLRFEQSKIGGNVRLDDVSCVDASDYSELSSRVTQTAQQWGVQLNQVSTATKDAIDDVNETLDNQSDALTATSDKIDDEITQRQAYMNFTQDSSGNPSLELGASENTNKVNITNEKVSFQSEGSEVAYISNKELHINNATIVQKLIIGENIGFIPRSDGHLTLTRI